jgi:hypothetical protein
MVWQINEYCNGYFLDCFAPVDGVTFVDTPSGPVNYTGCFAKRQPDYSLLEPLPEIKELVGQLQQSLGPCYSAVHIRRTDHVPLSKQRKSFTPDEVFENFIDSTTGPLYIACDCPETRQKFIDKYKSRVPVATPFDFTNNHRKSTLKNAIVDIYTCVGAENFMGSDLSSFSDLIVDLRQSSKSKRMSQESALSIKEPLKKHKIAIHTIFLPRENIFFVKEWLFYHFNLGVDHIYLYDNTGSIGRNSSTETVNKYGFDFYSITKGISDTEVNAILLEIISEFNDRCTIVNWQPLNDSGQVIYAQQESINHCIEHCKQDTDWLFFIDMDEYLFSVNNESLTNITENLSIAGHNRGYIFQKKFSDRFMNLRKHVIDIEECIDGIDTRNWAPKILLRTEAFDPKADFIVHGIPIMSGTTAYIDIDTLRFNHYNVNEKLLDWMKGFYKTEIPFKLNAKDTSMRRYREEVHDACKTFGDLAWRNHIYALSVTKPNLKTRIRTLLSRILIHLKRHLRVNSSDA